MRFMTSSMPPGIIEIVSDPDLLNNLGAGTFGVLIGLCQQAQASEYGVWAVPSHLAGKGRLAQSLSMSKPTLNAHLSKIEAFGYIFVEPPPAARRSDAGRIWLLWTAPMSADGNPWRPPGSRMNSYSQGVEILTARNLPSNTLPARNHPNDATLTPHKPALAPAQNLHTLHASPNDSINTHALGAETSPRAPGRLLDDQPCPPPLDEALDSLGFNGNLRVPPQWSDDNPIDPRPDILLEDWMAVVLHLRKERDRLKSAPAVLGGALKSTPKLHNLLKDASPGYVTRCQALRAAASARPAWCGNCDERTRLREGPEGAPYRCPTCHPLAAAASG